MTTGDGKEDNLGESILHHAVEKGILKNSPPAGPTTRLQSVRSFFSPWQRERSRRLLSILRGLDKRVRRGQKLAPSVRIAARRWEATYYSGDPAREVRFSEKTLINLYYKWRRANRSPDAIALHYRKQQRVGARQVAELVRAATLPGVTTFRAAFKRLPAPVATEAAYRYALSGAQASLLEALWAARRSAAALEHRLLANVIGNEALAAIRAAGGAPRN